MAKTFLRFEGKIINVFKIDYIEKDRDFLPMGGWQFTIDINKPDPELQQQNKHYHFSFEKESVRDEKLEHLISLLEEVESITFLNT